MDEQTIKRIIDCQDVKTFLSLNVEDMECCLIDLLYDHFYSKSFESLNITQKTIFLCMVLEDHVQADGILSLLEEDEIFFNLPQMKTALIEISALKTADALQEFIDFMPKYTFEKKIIPDWDWYMEENNRLIIENIDRKISSYPDGYMRDLYHQYLFHSPEKVKALLKIR